MRSGYAEQTLGEDVYSKVKQAKVLMVGAGGIGCELLKDLVLLGFKEVHIIDFDTIDLSNLNRQFLFGHQHIKKSKSLVAKETASKFNPNVDIVAHHANIKEEEFDIKWFQQFDIVFNALDNMDARRHVNRMCLAANVPLIESGTTGFHGQVSVIINGETECYDCTSKLTPKSYPVCTIRSTPSQPVHNIVWAKSYLFSQLFDESGDEDVDLEDDSGADNAEERQNMQREANELKDLRKSVLDADAFEKLVNKIFDTDIERLVGMESMWKSRKPPTPLKYETVSPQVEALDGTRVEKEDQKVWSVAEDLSVLKTSLKRLQTRMAQDKYVSFDKDDEDTLDFVVAAANIRSSIFGIDMKSKFESKQIAGNIIPAIATTNAMIAGVCVLQSLKVLQNKIDELRFVFIANAPDRVFINDRLNQPNPYCVVSGIDRATLRCDPGSTTLGQVVDELGRLKFSTEFSVMTDKLLYDPDYDDNTDKMLSELGIKHGTFITAVDEDDETNHANLELNLEKADAFEVVNVPDTFKQKPRKRETLPVEEEGEADDDELEAGGVKRKMPAEESDAKRPKTENNVIDGEDGEVVIEDDDDVVEID